MTVNHPSKMSSSYSPLFETKNKIINIHQADSNLLDTCDVCSHAHTRTLLAASYAPVLTLTAWLLQRAGFSLATCPATVVLIGCRAGCHHACWGNACVCMCEYVTVAANQNAHRFLYTPLFMFLSFVFFNCLEFLGHTFGYFPWDFQVTNVSCDKGKSKSVQDNWQE